MSSWNEINQLELANRYPEAITALESRLDSNAAETETVIRLGFNYWLSVSGNERLGLNIDRSKYAARFLELLDSYTPNLANNPDFCFAFGLGLTLDYYYFAPDMNRIDEFKTRGEKLMKLAAELDTFYERVIRNESTQEELAERFKGRGSFSGYYGVA